MKVPSQHPEQDEPQDTIAQEPSGASAQRPARSLSLTWPMLPPMEDPSQPETQLPRHTHHLLPHPTPAPHLCCRQCLSWDVTPAPQLREHAVHLVHSPHQ